MAHAISFQTGKMVRVRVVKEHVPAFIGLVRRFVPANPRRRINESSVFWSFGNRPVSWSAGTYVAPMVERSEMVSWSGHLTHVSSGVNKWTSQEGEGPAGQDLGQITLR